MTPTDRPARADRRLFGFAAGVWLASVAALRLTPPLAWLAAAIALMATGEIVGGHRVWSRPAGRGHRAPPRPADRRKRAEEPGTARRRPRAGRRQWARPRRADGRQWAGWRRRTGWRQRPDGGSRPPEERYRPRHRRTVAVWVAAGLLLGLAGGFAATAARTTARDDPGLRAILAA